MSQTTANVNLTTETFQNWLTKTNELRFALQSVIVTANTTLGNTSGNCHVNGFLAGNTLVATANLMGGTIAANSLTLPQISAANLNITTNTVFTANVYINAGLTFSDGSIGTHSNTHVFNSNLTANGTHLVIGTSTKLMANGSVGTSGQVLTTNGTGIYWSTVTGGGGSSNVQVLDSVTNTSIVYAAAANSAKTAYDAATAASTKADTAYTNATAFAANATNLTSGTVAVARLTGTYNISVSGNAATADRAFPKRSDGTNIDIIYTGQPGQPSWVVGTSDGLSFYPFNPSNFSVASATTAGRAKPQRLDSINWDFDYTAQAGQPTYVLGTLNGTTVQPYNPANFSVASATSATSASSVPWTGVSGRPTDLSSFTNSPGYINASSSLNATNLTSGTVATARLAAAVLRNVSTGYTGSGQVFIQSATPSSPSKGDVWLQI